MARTAYAISEGEKFNTDSTLVGVTCFSCHMTYAIPESLYKSALRYRGDQGNGWRLFCPLGHEWWFVGQTEEERLRVERDRARDEAARVRASRDQARAEVRTHKGRATRFKNERDRITERVEAGVCPHCNRTFKQLARHMKSQHADCAEH